MAGVVNNMTAIIPKILARGLLSIREILVMPRIINGDYKNEAAQKGATIDVYVSSAKTATDVVPDNIPPSPDGSAPKSVQISLNNWKKVNFGLTDKEIMEIDRNATFLPAEMAEGIRALANAVNASVYQESRFIYNTAGVIGFVPFDSSAGGPGVTSATDLRKVMNQNHIPRGDRRAVLDFEAEANMLALPQFSDAEKIMSADVKIEGEIGRKFGIDWFGDDGVLSYPLSAIGAGAMTANGVNAVGATSLSIAKGAGADWLAKAGNIFTIAGDTQVYVVTADTTVVHTANTSVPISPPLKIATGGAEALTITASHSGGIGFHKDAFAMAIRPLAASMADLALGHQFTSMTDPQTGISIRLEISRQYKQTMWELDILWGVKLVRPEYAVRLIGAP